MEHVQKDMAIMIADLSGYTALTETHGAHGAADLIDRFMEIIGTCLVGKCELKGRTGDEVLIVSSSPDDLIATAMMLIQQTSKENNFLQIHGGLHYGKVLIRNKDYFGTTINLTARIAAKAQPGCFWCSEEYKNAISNHLDISFQSKGKHSFKNLSEENEVHELVIEHEHVFYIDPVCRMVVCEGETATPHPKEENTFFCSQHCLEAYERAKS